MKLYKSFGNMSGNASGHTSESFASHTPINSLPPPMDVPVQIQQQQYQHEEAGFNPSRAIRKFQKPTSMYAQPQQMYAQPQQMYAQPQQQMYAQPQQMYQANDGVEHGVHISEGFQIPMCKRISAHLKECKKCSRKYSSDANSYICIIVGLVLFIMFLLTKIIDKFG